MCSRGTMSVWPGNSGRWSRKANEVSVSSTTCDGTSPATMRQKRQLFRGRVRPLPWFRRLALRDHHLATEVADLLAALVEAARLDRHDAAVGLARRLLLVEHLRLGVDR